MASISVIGKDLVGPNGVCDVVSNKQWIWTPSVQPDALKQIPYISMIEYQQTEAALAAQITYWAKQASQLIDSGTQALENFNNSGVFKGSTDADPYAGLYIAEPTKQRYIFPFLENYHHTVSNNWGSNKGPIGEFVQNVIVPAAKLAKPSAGIEPPKAWEGSSPVSYTFKFYLLNTTNNSDIGLNKKLVDRLVTANLQNRLNSVASEPPVFYAIDIPGVRTSPAAVISNLTITNEGQINRINGQNIPDAYGLIFNIQELISESRQIYAGAKDPTKKVNSAIIDPDSADAKFGGLGSIKGVFDSGKGLVTEAGRTVRGLTGGTTGTSSDNAGTVPDGQTE